MEQYRQYGSQDGAHPFCLGHPPHTMHPEEIVCRICGTLAAGAVLGLYRVQKLLGTGRSGQAYLAIHQRSGQPAVIKLFPYDASSTHLWDAARREVRVVTGIRHNAILAVYSCSTWHADQVQGSQFGSERGSYLLTLCQYIPGTLNNFVAHYQKRETQRAVYEQGTTVTSILINLIQQAGSALSAAHERGIAHGALVPGNMLLANSDRLWIADFGLARLHAPTSPYLAPELYGANNASIQRGDMRPYWSAVTSASDQYMFAVLCQQLFSYLLPQNEVANLLPVLQRATQPRPERRYPNVDLFVQDLLALTNATPYRPVGDLSPTSQGPRSGATPAPAGYGSPVTPALPLPAINAPAMPLTPMAPLTPAAPATPFTPSTSSPAEDWEKRGDKLFTMRDYEEALKAYHRALEANTRKSALWLALGDTYFALERHKEALMAYDQAMYLNPDDAQAWANRGTALDALGRHREALDCYERAEQLQ